MERRQGPLSCLLFGDDNNAPLFHLYKLRNCSVIRNNHRLKAMEDVLISDLKWRVINFTAQSSNYSFPIFCLGNLHERRHAPNLGKICSGKYKVITSVLFLNDLQSPRPSFLHYVVFSFVINKNSFKGQGRSRCK